jgi:hypothetical protein
MPDFNLRVILRLCPNELYKDELADPTWPTLEGVKLRFKERPAAPEEKPADPTVVKFPPSTDKGVASKDLEPRTIYDIEIPGKSFDGWAVYPSFIDTDDSAAEREIRLIPPEANWLLPLLLQIQDGNGRRLPVSAAEVTDNAGNTLFSRRDGYLYAAVPLGDTTLTFKKVEAPGVGFFRPQVEKVRFCVTETPVVQTAEIFYSPATEAAKSTAARITVIPTVAMGSSDKRKPEPLVGACATIRCCTDPPSTASAPAKRLAPGAEEILFDNLLPASYTISVVPPAQFNGWPIKESSRDLGTWNTRPEASPCVPAEFRFEEISVSGQVQTTDGRLVEQELELEIYGSSSLISTLTVKGGTFSVPLDWGMPLKIGLAYNADLSIDGIPLEPTATDQSVVLPPGTNTVTLQYKYGVDGNVVDDTGNVVPGAVIDVFDDQHQGPVATATADTDGYFIAGTTSSGSYFFAVRTEGGEPVTRIPAPVNSVYHAGKVQISAARKITANLQAAPSPNGGDSPGASDSGSHRGRQVREAITDLASYPLLTEEVTTIGPPTPAGGGYAPGGGGSGAGYGQTVDQVMRDVLGWRPSGDVAGFQTALAGAFQLREIEGHTAWTWQQRGYAVQADMGALTGAQASIYARAKSALDQMQPLLAGLTSINPALYPPQDLEAIRTVITSELQELVSELALPGGPRIQRVNELFRLLTGESLRSKNPDPDAVQGHLGTLRDRFGLTVAYVDTIDEERIVTNFRIIVEQVLTLKESWDSDRKVLSVLDSNTSLGTILIWLSRGLEAVCESVDDLTFALDSVFIDAAQRQVIQLDFTGLPVTLPELPLWKGKTFTDSETFKHRQAPILLSDLLDWVVRASRDEGPRIVQDAGKDGVLAFAPVLGELRLLIHATHDFVDSTKGATLPDGIRTPRVRRALDVLAGQLDEAANLAALVKRDGVPEITNPPSLTTSEQPAGQMQITLTGFNFRRNSSLFLYADNRQDVPDVQARHVQFVSPTQVSARLRIPRQEDAGGRLHWQVVLTNEDGSASEPFPVDLGQLSA